MAKSREQQILQQWVNDDLIHGALVEVGQIYQFTNPSEYPTTLISALATSAAKVKCRRFRRN